MDNAEANFNPYWIHDAQEANIYMLENRIDEIQLHENLQDEQYWNSKTTSAVGNLAFSDPNMRWSRLEKITASYASPSVLALSFLECARYDPVRAWTTIKEHPYFDNDPLKLYGHLVRHIQKNKYDVLFHPGLYRWIMEPGNEVLIHYTCNNLRDKSVALYTDEITNLHTLIQPITKTKTWRDWIKQEYKETYVGGAQIQWLVWGDSIFNNRLLKPYFQEYLLTLDISDKTYFLPEWIDAPTPVRNRAREAWKFEHPEFNHYRQKWLHAIKHDQSLQELFFHVDYMLLTPNSTWLYARVKEENALQYNPVVSVYDVLRMVESMNIEQQRDFWNDASYIICPMKDPIILEDAQTIVNHTCNIPQPWWSTIAMHVMTSSENTQLVYQEMQRIRAEDDVFYKSDTRRRRQRIRTYIETFPDPEDAVYHFFFETAGIKLNLAQYQDWKTRWHVAKELEIHINPFAIWEQVQDPQAISIAYEVPEC